MFKIIKSWKLWIKKLYAVYITFEFVSENCSKICQEMNLGKKHGCRLLFVLLYFFFWPLCCLFFFDLWILVTPLVSSNSSFMKYIGKNWKWQPLQMYVHYVWSFNEESVYYWWWSVILYHGQSDLPCYPTELLHVSH